MIDFDRLQTIRFRVLQVLNDPHAAATVKSHGHRLAHLRLGGDELDLEPRRNPHVLDGLLRRIALSQDWACRTTPAKQSQNVEAEKATHWNDSATDQMLDQGLGHSKPMSATRIGPQSRENEEEECQAPKPHSQILETQAGREQADCQGEEKRVRKSPMTERGSIGSR